MPTEEWFKDNPKVSGYISKTLYERLKRFASEKSSSMSQALTVVLAEYFGVGQEVDRASVGGVTLIQLQKQKEELDKLSESVNQRLLLVEQRFMDIEDRIESSKTNSKPKVDHSRLIGELENSSATVFEIIQAIEQDKEGSSTNSDSELPNELTSEGTKGGTQVKQQDESSIPLGRLKDELLKEEVGEKIAPSSEPINEIRKIPSVRPLSGGELSQRLGVDQSVIGRYKNGKRKQSLAEWSGSIDPEGVVWEFSEELKKYVPTQSNSDNSTSSLQFELPIEKLKGIVKPSLGQEDLDGTPFTEEQLAARLGMNSKRSLGNQRTGKQAASFPEWSRSRDPDGVAWYYAQESKLYYPVSLPSQPNSSLLDSNYQANPSLSGLNESTK